MTQSKKYICSAVASVLLIASHAVAQAQTTEPKKDATNDTAMNVVKFEQIIPEDAWLVLGIDDIANTRQRWSATPIGKWLQSDAVQALIRDDLEASLKKNKARLQELGLEEDAWSWPHSAGIAFYIVHDQELDADLPHFILSGVWNENADKVDAIFEAVFAEMQKKTVGSVSNIDIHGKSGIAIHVKDNEFSPNKRRRGRGGNSFVPEGALDHIETLYFVRDGNHFLLGSVKEDLEEALGVYAGTARKSVADSMDFKKTLDSVGRGDGWMVMLTSALHKVAGAGGPQVELVQPYLQTLFGDVHGYGFSLSSDAPGAQFQMLSSIIIDGDRQGLLAFPNPAKSASPPPAFVSNGATGYGTINLQFGEVMKLVESMVASLPEEMSADFDATLQQYGPDLSKAFARLGPDMHIVSRKGRANFELKDESKKSDSSDTATGSIYAIRCADEQALTSLLNLFMSQGGFETRDFNGNTIFEDKSRESCCGFGGGWFFLGKSVFVEECLRSVGGGSKNGTLAETRECQQVLADLGSNPVLCWGYMDMLISFDADEKQKSKQGPSVAASYDSNDEVFMNKLGVDVPIDPFFNLLRDEKQGWKTAFGPSVFSMTQESSSLITKIRLLPPTTP
ncbi:MAG: hypothetical protein EXS12_07840 [Phycisphaerales bacterium]|nr:hypothetical protein [Phycisphaerales bacterium]